MSSSLLPDYYKDKARAIAEIVTQNVSDRKLAQSAADALQKAILELLDEMAKELVAMLDSQMQSANINLEEVIMAHMTPEERVETLSGVREHMQSQGLDLSEIDKAMESARAKMGRPS